MTNLEPALEVLFEAPGLPAFDLPEELAQAYGGTLGFPGTRTFANFVASIDGVTAIPSVPRSNALIAAGSSSDRFLLGLLRACADVLVVGSGTIAASPRGLWTPAQAFPDAADAYAELRVRLGLAPALELVVLSASGSVDADHPALAGNALVLTTDAGLGRLGPDVPAVSAGRGPELDIRAAFELLRSRGARRILAEGGPRVLGSLLAAGLVDELFLTVSPILVGRDGGERFALVEGADLLATGPPRATLLGVRRDVDHLFLRYALGGSPRDD
jgi:riboflavin biosynthesis pyrimidine reductase